ncbi:hypothetical protein FMUND_6448 [Fusarium mundagurra]|uniref:Uncharacterized protein n=1 Tax=Fusarium mundagurra TaxID=1567541 RepID=A0A8H5YQ92_9HYPO|nr:hypothetical protein FMUND_6448 [Fusarium mundagurra]
MLSNENLQLLEALSAHQNCFWISDAYYWNDSFVIDLRHKIVHALIKLDGPGWSSHRSAKAPVTSTTADDGETDRDLAVENLRVQIDISNSLRGIWETLHSRSANFTHVGDESGGVDRGHGTLPPRVGPDTLHRRFHGTIPATSGDEVPSNEPETGSKRSAPNGDGKAADEGKKQKTG